MISLQTIEADLKEALKARDSVKADTLRGLKTRIQNEQIAKMKELAEPELVALVRSEAKRRKEAAAAFQQGSRGELADKELKEAVILEAYLPAQMPEEQLRELVAKTAAEMSAGPADFGKVMGRLKAQVGDQADGATLARLVKEKLK